MTAERWREVKGVFAAAIECAPDERSSFLIRECGGDEDLRREAERLIAAHENSGDFIETPAFQHAPEFLGDDPEELIGQRLGAYRIDAVLGAGGMGIVYLAFDERLERKVALKLLPPSFVADEAQLQRLRREARTASALNHPNIVTIHEIGEVDSTHFIATEFIEGATLRERLREGPIPPDEALEIARQIASALQVAHRAGIVHRDITPENIMLRPDAIVKVLDFGIAQLSEHAAPTEIIGTARYMSPEQRRGEPVDARSDLFSFGIVLSELVGNNCPAALQQIVSKCRREDPAQRHQTSEQLLADLRAVQATTPRRITPYLPWIGLSAAAALLAGFIILKTQRPAPLPEDKSIAVLPFENLSTSPESAFLADGMHDDVVTSLSKIKDLKVIARSSVMEYRHEATAGKLREIGRSLGVSHLLQGSVRQAENRVVVNVALIDARNQQQEWAQRYERPFNDALSLQGELAAVIAQQLRATLTPSEQTATSSKPTQNPEAYLAYLRASQIVLSDAEKVEAATNLYQQAVDLDPNFALARGRLALAAIQRFNWTRQPAWENKARMEAEEALRLRPDLGEARLALARCYLWAENNHERALQELARAADLLPNSAEVPLTAAFIYKAQNRWRERVAALYRAEARDPRNQDVLIRLCYTLQWVREWGDAIQTRARLAAVSPDGWTFSRRWSQASDEFRRTGDINVLKRLLAEENVNPVLPKERDDANLARYEVAMFERRYADAAQHLAVAPASAFGANESFKLIGDSKTLHEALLAVAGDGAVRAKEEALESARKDAETRLLNASDRAPSGDAYAELAILEALSGRKEEAIGTGLRAVELYGPETIERNQHRAALALVYAHVGEAEKAIELIEQLLSLPGVLERGAVYTLTLTDLKWRWIWDPLRGHPRFQKLLAGPEPKTAY